MKNILNKIIILIFSLNYFICFSFDKEIININNLYRLIFSFLNLILLLILLFKNKGNDGFKVNTKFLVLSLSFFVILLISSLFNDKILLGTESIILNLNLFIFAFIIFFLMQLIGESNFIDYFTNSVLISGAVLSLLLLIIIFGFFNTNFFLSIYKSQFHRNFASEILIGILPFSLFYIFQKEKILLKYFSIFSGFIILCTLFFLRTRTTYIALIILLLSFALIIIKIKRYSQPDLNFKKIYFATLVIMIFAFLIGFINVENADSDRVSMVKNINSMWN